MFEFIVLGLILILVALIIYKSIKRTKSGGCSCGGNCSTSCHGCDFINSNSIKDKDETPNKQNK